MTATEPFGGKYLTAAFFICAVVALIVVLPIHNEDVPSEIEVPVLMDLSGPNAEFGLEYVRGVQLAIDSLNADPFDIKFVMKVYDTEGDQEKLKEQYDAIVASGSPFLIGPFSGEDSIAIDAMEGDILCISPSVTIDAMSQFKNQYRLVCADKFISTGAMMIIKNTTVDDIVIVYDSSSIYSVGHLTNFLKASEEYPHINVEYIDIVDGMEALEAIVDAHPDLIFAPLQTSADFIAMCSYLQVLGIDCKYVTTDQSFTADVAETYDDICLITSACNISDGKYIVDYEKKFGEFRVTTSVYGYDAVMVVAESIFSNGYSVEEIRKGLDEIRFIGHSGVVKFNENGDRVPSFDVLRSENDEWVYMDWKEIVVL